MKPSEKEVLEGLRKTTLAYLSESEYSEIEKAVERDGILNLRGTASTVLKNAVRKHNDVIKYNTNHDEVGRFSTATGGGAGASAGGADAPKKISGGAGGSKQGEVTTTPGTLDKLFGKGETMLGDEFERKVTEQWSFEMTNPSTGKKFQASVYDWMRYDEMGLSAEQGQKLAPMSRSENGTFSIATTSKQNAGAVQDYITSNSTGNTSIGGGTMSGDKTPGMTPFSGVNKATSVKTGDMVSWNSSGGNASGKVIRVISSGKINVPDSSFTIEGTEDEPAALIQLYRDGKPTKTKVGHKVGTLKKA